MYLVAYFNKYFMDKPVSVEVTNRAAVSCLLSAFNNQRISYVVRFDGYAIDHSFFTPQAEQLLSAFIEDEVAA